MVPVEPAGSVGIPQPLPMQYTTTQPDGDKSFFIYDNASTDARVLVIVERHYMSAVGQRLGRSRGVPVRTRGAGSKASPEGDPSSSEEDATAM